MNLPKFVFANNTDYPSDIFVIHLDYPRFIINLVDDEVTFLEDLDETESDILTEEMERLIQEAGEFYDREMIRYEKE